MTCVNTNGTLTSSALMILTRLKVASSPQDAARAAGKPLFLVRASLSELKELELVRRVDNTTFVITEKGLKALVMGTIRETT